MILLRRLNGTELGVNADLIERVESNPDTVLTLVDGTKYVVSEPAEEVVARIIEFRARILAAAERLSTDDGGNGPGDAPHGVPASRPVTLRLVDGPAGADHPTGSPHAGTTDPKVAIAEIAEEI